MEREMVQNTSESHDYGSDDDAKSGHELEDSEVPQEKRKQRIDVMGVIARTADATVFDSTAYPLICMLLSYLQGTQ